MASNWKQFLKNSSLLRQSLLARNRKLLQGNLFKFTKECGFAFENKQLTICRNFSLISVKEDHFDLGPHHVPSRNAKFPSFTGPNKSFAAINRKSNQVSRTYASDTSDLKTGKQRLASPKLIPVTFIFIDLFLVTNKSILHIYTSKNINRFYFAIDFADIRMMMKHKLEGKKSSESEIEKQLGLLDLLFEHRLEHIDGTVVREEADKCKNFR